MPKNRQVQKVGIEPTSSPPQTVPSTADLLLDNKTTLYMLSSGREGNRTPDGSYVTLLQSAPTRIADSRHSP